MNLDISSAKSIPIKKYLLKMGIEPTKQGGSYLLYHAPYREDKHPSMAVFPEKNTWKDYATGQGGSIIDLVMLTQEVDFTTAAKRLLDMEGIGTYQPVIRPNSTTKKVERESEIVIFKETNLSNKALLEYLTERAIPADIAKEHLKEVYFTTKEGTKTNKRYFALAFKNNKGGYELRNKYFKGATSKEVTTIDRNNEKCLVFEGFMDYLSHLALFKELGKQVKEDVVILNSVALLKNAKDFLCKHKEINCYLDNDKAGKQAVEDIKSWNATDEMKVHDVSVFYAGSKDLNEHLQHKRNQALYDSHKSLKLKSNENRRYL